MKPWKTIARCLLLDACPWLTVWANEAVLLESEEQAPRQERVAELVTRLAPVNWKRLSVGNGSRRPRWYNLVEAVVSITRVQVNDLRRQKPHLVIET